MSIVKGIKVGNADITSIYDSTSTLSDTEGLEVVSVSLGGITSPNNTTYDGNPQYPTPTVTATVGGETVVLVKDTDYTLSYSNNTNVGTATVTATGKGNYSGTVSSTWTIGGATITVDASDQEYTYNGSSQGIGISASVVSGTPTVKYGLTSGTYDLTTTPQFRNVKTSGTSYYTVYYQVTAANHNTATGSYNITINPLIAVLTWGTTSWTYDGEVHSTTCVVSNKIFGDDCDVILSGNSITNIGSTTVTATGFSGTDGGNYTLPVEQVNIQRTLTITAGMFVKLSGVWTPVKKVYKKVSGSWVQQDMSTAFSTSKMYKKMN